MKNLPASVRQRLLDLSRQHNEPFDRMLTRYAVERLLYRLSQSPHAKRLALKGSMLFLVWDDHPHRPTRDVDFLGFGSAELQDIMAVFRDLCGLNVAEDGLVFQPNTLTAENIREEAEYGGIRVKLTALLESAKIPVQADIGFGDVVTPELQSVTFPTLLDFPAPQVLGYPVYTVIAEKFEALVRLGEANTRLKDFYDLDFLSRTQNLDLHILRQAIVRTFERRKTTVPTTLPTGLSDSFARSRETSWQQFHQRNKLPSPQSFLQAVKNIRGVLDQTVNGISAW